jgi:hypothetical protein
MLIDSEAKRFRVWFFLAQGLVFYCLLQEFLTKSGEFSV